MNRGAALLFAAAIALLLPTGGTLRAEVDTARERLVGAVPPLLRWDNVEGAPIWAGGVPPIRARRVPQGGEGGGRPTREGGQHRVTLRPGEATRLWLPAGAVLRLRAPAGRLAPEDLAITVSSGSGVAVSAVPVQSADGRDLLLGIPPAWRAVVTVTRSAEAAAPLDIALFVARHSAPPDPVAYRRRIDLPSPDLRLHIERRWESLPHDLLEAGIAQELAVTGPARLMLETRLPYRDGPPAWVRSYRVSAALDGRPLQVLEFSTSPDGTQPLRVEGSGEAVGALQRGWLDIPTGTHRLTLDADARLLVRVLAHEGRDWLLPGLNAVPGSGLDDVVTGGDADGGAGIWAVEEADLRRALGAAATARLARRLARDAQWNAGLAGTVLMERAAERNPGLPEAVQVAERLRGAATFWRDLVPAGAVARQERAWVALPVLNDPLAPLPRTVPPGLPRETLLSTLASAIFVPPPGPGAPMAYALPEREAPSALRLLAVRAGLGAPTVLWLQVGEEAPRRVVVHPAPELPPEAYSESPGRAGLARLPQTEGPEGTRSGAFAATRPPGPMVEAGAVEIPLPRAATRIRIWSETPGAPPVALQYRASRQDALQDEAYAVAVSRLGQDRARALFIRALSDAVRCAEWLRDPLACPAGRAVAGDPAARTLLNAWIPTLRLLRARDRVEFANVAADPSLAPPRSTGGLDITEARALERRGDPLRALEAWTRIAEGAGGSAWWQAQLGRAAALRRMGEAYLAERLLKAIHRAPAAPEATRRAAFEELRRLADDGGEPDALLGPLAAQLARGAEPALLADLVAALAAAGRDLMAAETALLLPPARRPASAPGAALRAGWANGFERLVTEEPDAARRALWRGHAASRAGDEAAALDAFRAAGAEGAPWAAALARGQAIRAQLGAHGAATPAAARDWGAWWAAHPGPRIWEDAEGAVTGHAGGAVLEALGRDLPLRAWRAEPGRPVRLQLAGPASLRIEVRPLHRGAGAPPLDGMVEIAIEGGARVTMPVSRNQPAPGLALVGGGGPAGTAVAETLTLPAGRHSVTVTPRGFAALVRASVAQPALPRAVLPPPQPVLVPSLAGAVAAGDPAATLRHRMGELIRRFEAPREGDLAALTEAARLAQANPETPGLSALWARFAQQSRWERVTSVDSSAGYRSVPVPTFRPEAPALRARLALLPRLADGEQILAAGGDVAFSFINTIPTTVQADLSMADIPGVVPAPITVAWRLDEGDARLVRLTPARPGATLRIPVPEGEHGLRFSLADPQANRFVRLRLAEAGDRPALREAEREFDVATAAEPVVLTLEGPAWLRIDERGPDGEITPSYRAVPPGWQRLSLGPPPGQAELPVRIFRLVADRDATRPAPPPLPAAEAAPAAPVTVPDRPARAVALQDRLPLGGQEDGTWSLTASVERALPPDEDAGISRSALYAQLLAGWRYHDATSRTYWRGEILSRQNIREGGWPVLGVSGRVEHALLEAPLTLFARTSAFAQRLEGYGTAWSGTLSAGILWDRDINETTSQYASLAGFARALGGVSAQDAVRLRVDPDVFSPYKNTHRHGLSLTYALRHLPWRDTIWTASAMVVTNEDINFFRPDRASISADWLQLLGPAVLEAGVTQTRYFADDNRARARDDTALRLGLLRGGWTPTGQRWEIGARIGYRTLAREWVGLFSVAWHFSAGRGVTDFAPGEVPFAGLRERPLFDLPRNGMSHAPGY